MIPDEFYIMIAKGYYALALGLCIFLAMYGYAMICKYWPK